MMEIGVIERVSGPVVWAENMYGSEIGEVVHVGEEKLIGEIIRLTGTKAVIQVYESTSGIKPGENVYRTGKPLRAELGPGLIGMVFDGIQRPLEAIREKTGYMIRRGVTAAPLSRGKKWEFTSAVSEGEKVRGGDIIGTVQETSIILHRVLVPLNLRGEILEVTEGKHTIEEPIGIIKTPEGEKRELYMKQEWPVRVPRPVKERLRLTEPLLTGQRIIDTVFPIPKGGTAAIPGGFGTGKCISPDTPVLLKNGGVKPIEKLFEASAERGVFINDGYECFINPSEPYKLYSLRNGRIEESTATLNYQGYTDKLIEIRTRSGRSVKVTPSHKLFIFNKDLTVREIPAGKVEEGDYIVAPRLIPHEGSEVGILPYLPKNVRVKDEDLLNKMVKMIDKLRERETLSKIAEKLKINYGTLMNYYHRRTNPTAEFIEKLCSISGGKLKSMVFKSETTSEPLKIPENLNEEFAEFIGLLLSDGMIKGERSVYFFNNDKALLERFRKLCLKLFNLNSAFGEERTVKYVVIHNSLLVKLLENLGIPKKRKSEKCKIPEAIKISKQPISAAFLKGYILGDGTFYKYTLEIGTASKEMWIDLSYLLTRFGILYRMRRQKGYYRIFIEGKRNLKKLLNVMPNIEGHKFFEKIKRYIEDGEERCCPVDMVPLDREMLSYIVKKFKVEKELRKRKIKINNYIKLGEKPTVETFREIVSALYETLGEIEDSMLKRFKYVAEMLEYVYIDRVDKKKIIDRPSIVYDFTVPEEHNFIGGEGPFFLHNTVMLHQIAKWADAQVIIYVGCGERGNEMTDVLTEFPELEDPRTGKKLIERTIMIANTSNMPVAAREASIYIGATLGEYYRDQGFDVALVADSTSRWAEALREISGRLEEMPAERGFPAYLPSRIAEFYERAGRAKLMGSKDWIGSLTIMGAVSPPGGDFSEPVTQHTKRFISVFWALDKDLAFRRHFPAINWIVSYSKYVDILKDWWIKQFPTWYDDREEMLSLLTEAERVEEIARIIGEAALPDEQQLTLLAANVVKEGFLMQNAFSPIDSYCLPEKQAKMLNTIMDFYRKARELVRQGTPIEEIRKIKEIFELIRMKERKEIKEIETTEKKVMTRLKELETKIEVTI